MHSLKSKVGAVVLLALTAGTVLGAPGTITTTLSPPGPILVGDEFTVTMRISGYTDPTQIDGFNFTVAYNSNLFSIVSNSFGLGDLAGPDQQWLSKPNQELPGAGYSLVSFNDDSYPGLVTISMADLGFNDPEQGTLANSGFLVSFKLKAIAKGTGNLTLAAFLSGTVLLDANALSPAGVPVLSGATMIVSAIGPSLAIVRSGTNVVISWPAPSTGFSLQCATNLAPVIAWQPVTNGVVVILGQNTVTVPATGKKFFRLICP